VNVSQSLMERFLKKRTLNAEEAQGPAALAASHLPQIKKDCDDDDDDSRGQPAKVPEHV
jgi:hypothetical protein